MAKCLCGNDIETCSICRRNRVIEQFGGHHSGDVMTNKQNGGLTKLYMEDYCPDCEDESNEELMKEYVLKSFTVTPEITEEDDE